MQCFPPHKPQVQSHGTKDSHVQDKLHEGDTYNTSQTKRSVKSMRPDEQPWERLVKHGPELLSEA